MKKRGIYLIAGVSLGVLVVFILVSGLATAVFANETCTVEVDGSGSHPTIQAAVDDASCHYIEVGAGIFYENVVISRAVAIQGHEAMTTTVDGGGEGSVFAIQASGLVSMTSLAITNGSADYGGGIANEGRLALANTLVSTNKADHDGGGIFNSGTLTFTNSTVSRNKAGYTGGGIKNTGNMSLNHILLSENNAQNCSIYCYGGAISNSGRALVTNSTLTGNQSASKGGGVFNTNQLTIKNSLLSENVSSQGPWWEFPTRGGGIYNQLNGVLEVIDSTLVGNTATDGGAISNSGAMTLTASTLSGNKAIIPNFLSVQYSNGGGIRNETEGTLKIVDSNLVSNTADYGAGIANEGRLALADSRVSTNTAAYDGGGIFNSGTLTVSNGTISGNNAFYIGGGIKNIGNMSLNHILLSDNSAWSFSIYCYGGAIYNSGTALVANSILTGNNSASKGGGVFNTNHLSIKNSLLSDNDSSQKPYWEFPTYGGGIYNHHNGVLEVVHSTLSGNTAAHGGAIANSGTMTLTANTLAGNKAAVPIFLPGYFSYGGGIYNQTEGTLTIVDSTLASNAADRGGGIYNSEELTVRNSTLYGNRANKVGGGIAIRAGNLTILNSTIAGNEATDWNATGGGIFQENSLVSMGNTILADNKAGLSGHNCKGTVFSLDYNLVNDLAGCIIEGDTSHNIIAEPILGGPPAGYGGPTPTIPLGPGSPAIDSGYCPGESADQRGLPRPVDQGTIPNSADGCDIGAYEVQKLCQVPGGQATIQEAADDPECQVIHLGEGTFRENVSIGRTLMIQGRGAMNSIVDGGRSGSVFTIGAGSAVTMTGLVISNGLSLRGGGIHNEGTLAFYNGTVSGNTAEIQGGGIYNAGQAYARNATISGNVTQEGGGFSNDGSLSVANSTISGNSSSVVGGGIANGGRLTITSSTVADNSAATGGGGLNNRAGLVTLANTILAHNAAATGPDCLGAITSLDYNLLEDPAGCDLSGETTHTITGLDPLLEPLKDNGGWTETQALGQSSPALDAGYCPEEYQDQRGIYRPKNLTKIPNVADGCDIGAFEHNPPDSEVYLYRVYLPFSRHRSPPIVVNTLPGN